MPTLLGEQAGLAQALPSPISQGWSSQGCHTPPVTTKIFFFNSEEFNMVAEEGSCPWDTCCLWKLRASTDFTQNGLLVADQPLPPLFPLCVCGSCSPFLCFSHFKWWKPLHILWGALTPSNCPGGNAFLILHVCLLGRPALEFSSFSKFCTFPWSWSAISKGSQPSSVQVTHAPVKGHCRHKGTPF